ncbi:MAG: reverse transcriptase family protein, partial [Kangiellaceae bacterium]|nr:reverse transcriptase family protein [Kangiellaceae bacterium]
MTKAVTGAASTRRTSLFSANREVAVIDQRKTHNENLLIVLINPWSICNKAEDINDFIIEYNIDILAITETWLTGTACDGPTINALLPNGYEIIHAPRRTRGGGTALVYRQSLNVTRVAVSSASFEVLECVIKGPIVLRICVVYQPYRTALFMEEFSSYLAGLATSPGHLLVLGDFNLHVDDPLDKCAQDFLTSMSSLGLEQHVTTLTHRNGHTLDLVLTPLGNPLDLTWKSIDCGFPDHYALFIQVATSKPPLPRKCITYRKTRSIRLESLREAVASSPLTNAQHVSSLDDSITIYHHELEYVMNTLAPLKTCEITMRPDSRWFNDEIRAAKQHRRQIERLWRRTGLTVHREMFMTERNRVNTLSHNAKERFYKGQVAENAGNQQQLYKVVKTLLGQSGAPQLPMEDPAMLAQRFSDFFVSKIQRIQESIPDVPLSDPEEVTHGTPLENFCPVTLDHLVRLIRSSSNKQCSLDPLPTNLLKLVIPEVCPFILHVINTSLSTGRFPRSFKTALVSPQLKKPSLNPEELSNYRPISNLSFLSKTLERVVAEQLITHLDQNDLLEPCQSAYRKHHSTETALLRIHTDIRQALADNMVVLMAMLDLSAAFDTISHEILIRTLSTCGIQGTALQWLSSYIHDQTQTVMVNAAQSNPKPLTTGVPQGSVLGPLLFSVYTRSLGALLRSYNVEYHIYADDTQVYLRCAPNETNAAIQRLEECLDAVQLWMSAHRLKLNANKTEFIVFCKKEAAKLASGCVLRVGGNIITPTDYVKNIGVYMDKFLSGEKQVNNVCRVAYAQLKSLSKIKCFINHESLESIIHA